MKHLITTFLLLFITSVFSQYTYIPDDNFEQALISKGLDDVLDDYVLTENINTITILNIANKGISNLTGLQDFVAIEYLNLNLNNLSAVVFPSTLTALEEVHIPSNNLISLDVSGLSGLQELYCNKNNLTSLDINSNANLKTLVCWQNELTSINLTSISKLETFYGSTNKLTSLDVSSHTSLKELDIDTNELINLNVTGLVSLHTLDLEDNKIRTIDVSTNSSLRTLKLSNNDLNIFKVKNGNNRNISNFRATGNPYLGCIEVDDVTYATTNWTLIDTGTIFSENCTQKYSYIPGDNFEQALIDLGYDDVLDDWVLTANINDLKILNVHSKNISDLTGLQDFVALEYLNLNQNNLSTVVFPNTLIALNEIHIPSNILTIIDVSGLTALEELYCNSNNLTSLDINANVNLKKLVCWDNQLTNIDLSSINKLETIFSSNNKLTNLDVSMHPNLKELDIDTNELISLNINELASLHTIDLGTNKFEVLDFSTNSALRTLNVSNNLLSIFSVKNGNNGNISSFNANNNPHLNCIEVEDVTYSNTNWTNIDVHTNFSEDCNPEFTAIPDDNFEQALISLGLDDVLDDRVSTININTITSLNISSKSISDLTGIESFVSLEELFVNDNDLSIINLSTLEVLSTLNCKNNNLVVLDLSTNVQLTYLNCEFNANLVSLDLNHLTNLTSVFASNNYSLSTLKIKNGNNINISSSNFNISDNKNLFCVLVDDATYSSTNWMNKDFHTYYNEECDPNYTYVPGDNFEQALIDRGYDDVLDDWVLTANINAVTILNIHTKNISDLRGLESFVALEYINLNQNNLSTVIFPSTLIALDEIHIPNNNLTSLDVSGLKALEELYCNSNSLTSLDINANVNLKTLICWDNQLSAIGLSEINKLETILPSNNKLTNLDVSMHPNLKELKAGVNELINLNTNGLSLLHTIDLDNNKLENLDFSTNVVLRTLKVSNNLLSVLNVKNGNNVNFSSFNASSNPHLNCIEVEDVTYSNTNWTNIDEHTNFSEDCNPEFTAIPDDNFEQALISLGLDDVADDKVSTININTITSLNISSKSISDLTGIENFVSLEELNVSYNNLSTISLNTLVDLRVLNCKNNNLNALDLSINLKLTQLDCGYNNNLTSLDLNHLTNLASLLATNNDNLSVLKIKNGNNVNISGNTFNLTNNKNLFCVLVDDVNYSNTNWNNKEFHTYYNEECNPNYTYVPGDNFEQALIDRGYDDVLDDWVLTANINTQKVLNIANKSISDVRGLQGFVAIEYLNLNQNNLTTVVFPNTLVALNEVHIPSNNLTELDVSDLVALEELYCNSNNLINLDIDSNVNLKKVFCSGNQLTTINLTSISKLETLSFSNNNLTNLDVSTHVNLKELNANHNQLTNLNVIDLASLHTLELENNKFQTIDLSTNTFLRDLNISENELIFLDISSSTNLQNLYISNNRLINLDVSKNIGLDRFDCSSNNITDLDLSTNSKLDLLTVSDNNLISLNVKNGSNGSIFSFNTTNNPDLTCVEVDNVTYSNTNWTNIDAHTNFSEDCSSIWTVNTNPETTTVLLAVSGLDVDNDGEITLAEAAGFTGTLDLSGENLTDVEGLQAFINVTIIDLRNNNISDFSPLTDASIPIIQKSTGKTKYQSRTGVFKLEELYISNNNVIETLDVRKLVNLKKLVIKDSPKLVTVGVQNGNNANITMFDSTNTPKLSCILVDDVNASYLTTWVKDEKNTFVADEADCRAKVLDLVSYNRDNNISIHPNPAKDNLTIISNEKIIEVEIFNYLGKSIYKSIYNSNTIDISILNKGVFLMKIKNDKGNIYTQKLIKI